MHAVQVEARWCAISVEEAAPWRPQGRSGSCFPGSAQPSAAQCVRPWPQPVEGASGALGGGALGRRLPHTEIMCSSRNLPHTRCARSPKVCVLTQAHCSGRLIVQGPRPAPRWPASPGERAARCALMLLSHAAPSAASLLGAEASGRTRTPMPPRAHVRVSAQRSAGGDGGRTRLGRRRLPDQRRLVSLWLSAAVDRHQLTAPSPPHSGGSVDERCRTGHHRCRCHVCLRCAVRPVPLPPPLLPRLLPGERARLLAREA